MAMIDTIKQNLAAITEDEYFKISEDRKVLTPENIGGLCDYPALFKAMQDDRELRPALTEAMYTGRAMNDFISMPTDEFLKMYVVADGPVNPKTNKPYGTDSKMYLEWRASQDRIPVSTAQFDMFGKMAAAYNGHQLLKDIAACHTLIRNAIVKFTYDGVECLCKIDNLFVSDGSVFAVDVKTTDDIMSMGAAATRLHYREQQAFISFVMKSIGVGCVQTRIAAIEKGDLPRCGVFGVKGLDAYEEKIAGIVGEYAESLKSGVFGTRFEAPALI